MINWYNSVYKGFFMTAIVAFIIGFFSQGEVSIAAYIAGYSVLILAIIMILIILISNILRLTQGESSFGKIFSIVMSVGPFLCLLGTISFILYLMITYKKNIISGHVSPGYSSFSNINTILLFIQLYMLQINISSEKFSLTGKLTQLTSSFLYLLIVLQFVCCVILFTILKYYTTDGFTLLKI